MPKKIDPDKNHGQKVIELFFKLFFSPYEYSLAELSRDMACSKQTVGRIVDQINSSTTGVKIEDYIKDNKRFFRIKKEPLPAMSMNLSQFQYGVLQMCCAFTQHLISKDIFNQAINGLEKSQVLIKNRETISPKHFGAFMPGSIDYSGHQQIIQNLLTAMETAHVCKITYQSLSKQVPKTYHIKPLKLFVKDDTIYLHTKLATPPGKIFKHPRFDPLLVIHRIQALEITETHFEVPGNFDFEKTYNQTFGVMKEAVFQTTIKFSGYAAKYVKERIWSQDQIIKEQKNGEIDLTFSATSPVETLFWVMSFGHEAKAIEPDWFVQKVKDEIQKTSSLYS